MLAMQDGGTLGSYECGVYSQLARYLQQSGRRLRLVAGTSLGAINAAFITSTLHHAAAEGFRMLTDPTRLQMLWPLCGDDYDVTSLAAAGITCPAVS
jgi:predicted acylesterase/phospholipase RssA